VWEDRRVIVDIAAYRNGERLAGVTTLHEALARCARDDGTFLWLGLHEPTRAEFDDAVRALGLHELAVEDAIKAHQRPKLEVYGDSVFIVLRTARYVGETETVDFGEILLFVGARFVVAVRHGEASELASVRRRLEGRPDLLRHGVPAVVHAVLDRVVDDYFPVLDGIEDDIEQVEGLVFSHAGANPVERIYELKREVLELHRVATPLLLPLEQLNDPERAQALLAVDELRPYFRDVHDHLVRVTERIAAARELLTGVLEANLTQVSVRQNEDMRRISAWAAIAVAATLVTGVYGMNFDRMPLLRHRLGFAGTMAFIGLVALVLHRYFRRRGWL
jgi:magnesium transporter